MCIGVMSPNDIFIKGICLIRILAINTDILSRRAASSSTDGKNDKAMESGEGKHWCFLSSHNPLKLILSAAA